MRTTGIGRRRVLAAGLGIGGLAAAPGCGARTAKAPATTVTAAVVAPPTDVGAVATEVDHGPRTRPEVALTFHGQGDPALVEALLGTVEALPALLAGLADRGLRPVTATTLLAP